MLDREEARPAVGRKSRAKVAGKGLPPGEPARSSLRPKQNPPPNRPKGPGSRGYAGGWQPNDRKLKDEDLPRVIAALRQTRGIKDPAARILKVSGKTFRRYVAEHREELDEELREIDEALIDACESAMVRAALEREDIRALQLVLSVKGRDRGWNWGSRHELTGPNGSPLVTAGPSVTDMIQVLEAVLERRQDPPPLAPPPPALLDLSAESVPADPPAVDLPSE